MTQKKEVKMKRAFELLMLWLIENTAKLCNKLISVALLLSLYIIPLYTLIYENGDDFVDAICLFWIIILYPSTFFSLAYSYYRYLICKYRDGKIPNNDYTRFMESNDL